MKINYCVYKITNLINYKIYIGKDKYNNPKYMGSGKILKLAYKKYGILNFTKEIICFCDNEDEYNEREKFYIKEYNSFAPIGYNINIGGKGGDNFKNHPDKEKVKNVFKKLRESNVGRHASNEVKEKMSQSRKGKKLKPCEKIKCEYCDREIDKRNYHRWHGENCTNNPDNKVIRKKIIIYETKEEKKIRYKKVSEKLKGRKISDNQKEITSKRMINFWSNEENKKHKCEYCGIETTKVNHIRWHGEKCKNK